MEESSKKPEEEKYFGTDEPNYSHPKANLNRRIMEPP
jgi:hypothetical protein